MNKTMLLAAFAVAAGTHILDAKVYELKSPGGNLSVKISDGKALSFSLYADGKALLEDCEIGMETDRGEIGKNAAAKSADTARVKDEIKSPFYIKSSVPDACNQLKLDFGRWQLFVRAYDDMMAYRFAAKFGGGDMEVKSETLELKFDGGAEAMSQPTGGTRSDFETETVVQKVGDLAQKHSSCLPYIVSADGAKVAVLESGVFNYPSMRVQYSKEKGHPQGWWSRYPKKIEVKGNINTPVEFFDCIAKTSADRAFPWRILYVARSDGDLAVNDAVYKLAAPSRLKDASWIKPGVSVWEWWNSCNLEGVDFQTGMNTDTYKHYIDFAAKYGADYFLIDEGWLDGEDPVNGRLKVDVKTLAEYAKGKNIGTLLWMRARYMQNSGIEKTILKMKELGVDGLKVDFVEHDDQIANEFHENVAAAAAKHGMVIDFHGCYRPNGLNRTYPNVLNFEGGRGNEHNRGHSPTNPTLNLNLLFTRMLTGPFDFTPGSMRHVRNRGEYAPNNPAPTPIGTRANQIAMFVMYFGPLQVMCDSPTEYERYPETARFMATVPTVWDDSVALEAEFGEKAVIARRKGDTWYVAGMSGEKNGHTVKIPLSKILAKGKKYEMELFRDTVNSSKTAKDCKREVREVAADETLEIKMAAGGGFAMRIAQKK